jgi:hypothetical protein
MMADQRGKGADFVNTAKKKKKKTENLGPILAASKLLPLDVAGRRPASIVRLEEPSAWKDHPSAR